MKHKNLKDLYNLHKETKWNAEALRLAIEVIFQRDYYEDLPEAKTKDQMVDHMLLQDDLEDKEKRLHFITQPKTDVLPY
jgi:predicted type IV restriction endonuclease